MTVGARWNVVGMTCFTTATENESVTPNYAASNTKKSEIKTDSVLNWGGQDFLRDPERDRHGGTRRRAGPRNRVWHVHRLTGQRDEHSAWGRISAMPSDIRATPTPAATSIKIMYGSVIS